MESEIIEDIRSRFKRIREVNMSLERARALAALGGPPGAERDAAIEYLRTHPKEQELEREMHELALVKQAKNILKANYVKG